MKTDNLKRFMSLFQGYEFAFGKHTLMEPDEDGKVKGRAQTIPSPVTENEFREHLSGRGSSLGLIPLRSNNTCLFGAIDIDIKGAQKLRETHTELETKLRGLGIPCFVCRSKSGGAHIYFFFSEEVPAKLVQAKLNDFAAALGYGGTEVFPKQITRANEKDYGNWINICYYESQNSQRYAVYHGEPLTFEQFLEVAESSKISLEALKALKVERSNHFEDGPPCLQQIATLGFEQGSRNNSLLNVAIYLKMKYPDEWQDMLHKYNYDLLLPPLPNGEVQVMIKSLLRKEYTYTCQQPPINNYCNKKLCHKREFGKQLSGPAGDSSIPIDSLTKCISKDSVRWYAEHQGERIELTTEQLMSPELLQKVFLEKFTVMIYLGKKDKWHEKLRSLLQTVEIVEDPEDASRVGQFEKLVDSFLTATRPARNRDELAKGNCWLDGGIVHFRSEDLFNYLTVRRFSHQHHEVWQWLKALGSSQTQVRVLGKNLRVWTLPEPNKYEESAEIPLPSTLDEDL